MTSPRTPRCEAFVLGAVTLLGLAGCGHATARPGPSGAARNPGTGDLVTAGPLSASPLPAEPVPIASPITAPPVATPGDVQAAAASQFIAPPSSAATAATRMTAPAAAPVMGVSVPVFSDPVAVARAYTAARWSFHAADAVAYTAALTAPGLTTPAFRARSQPTALALAQGATAEDVSVGTVTAAGISAEAPRTGRLAFVTVAYTVTDTFTGSPKPLVAARTWSLRAVRAAAGPGWLVDGVALDG